MKCKKCGFQLTESDQFCRNCGAPVDNISAQNNNVGLTGQSMQDYTTQSAIQQPISQTSKKSNIKFIIIGIIIVAVIAVGVIVAINMFGSKKSNNSEVNNGDSSIVNNNKSNYTVKFKGFTFKIPTNLIYETQTDAILLGDEGNTWAVYIEVLEASYSKILSNKSQLQSLYQSDGYTSSAAVEKTIGGMPFITLEVSKSGKNSLFGLTKANSMNIFAITAYNIDNEYDYKLLETVSSILSSAEYGDATNNVSVFEKTDTSIIAELAK